MNEKKFELNELPYDKFEVLGMDRRNVLNLKPKELTSLLAGEKTGVMDFIVDRKEEIKGKLSLVRNKDNSVSLMLHPVRQEIKNDIGLTEYEIKKLKEGKLIDKKIDGERHLVQLDPETNEILKAKTKDINLPPEVKGNDREKLLIGRDVILSSPSGDINIKLDLIDPKGYKIEQEQNQEQKMNLEKEQKKGRGSKTKLIIAASLLISPTIGIYFLTKELLERDKRRFDLTNRDIQKLLNGNKTVVKDLSQIEKDLKGKLSLIRNEDNSVSFAVHPVRQEIKNDIGLANNEIEKLKQGELIDKKIDGERHLVQLDPETKEVIKAKEEIIPSHIKGVEITPEQKELLRAGKEIQLKGENETFSAKVDLNNISGIGIDDDRNKLQIIAEKGIKGIDELFQGAEQKQEFLDKYNLRESYSLAKEYEKDAWFAESSQGRESSKKDINKQQEIVQEQAKLSAERLNNEAESKLMTQMSNMDKDLNLSVNNSEQKNDNLAKNLFEKEKAIEYDLATPGVSDVVHTDANRAEKMELEKSQKGSQQEDKIEHSKSTTMKR